MKDAGVIEDETFTRLQTETDFHCRVIDDFAKPAIGIVIGWHLLERHIGQRRRRPVVEPHAGQLAIRRQLDHRPPRDKMRVVTAGIFKSGAMIRQKVEPCLILLAKAACSSKAVHHHAVSTGGRTFKTVENLDGRHRIAVGVVGMRLKAKAGIGKICRVDFGPHLELAAIIRLTYIAEQIDHLHQRTILDRAVRHMCKPITRQRTKPVAKRRTTGLEGGEACCRQLGIQAAVPACDLWPNPATDSSALLPVIPVRHQPARVEGNGASIAGEGDVEHAIRQRRTCHPQVSRNIRQCDQPLAIARRARGLVHRVVAKPDCVEPCCFGAAAVSQGKKLPVLGKLAFKHRLSPSRLRQGVPGVARAP